MKKARKKGDNYGQQKVAAAQHRNEFITRLKYLVNSVSGDNTTDRLIPEPVYRQIYENRARSIRITVGKQNSFCQAKFEEIKRLLVYLFKEVKLNFTSSGPLISVDQYFTAGQSLKHFINNLSDDYFPGADVLKNKLSILIAGDEPKTEEDIINDLSAKISLILDLVILCYCDFRKLIIWTEKKIIKESSSDTEILQLEINSYSPACLSFEKDGKKRLTYEVCWGHSSYGLIKLELPPELLGLPEDYNAPLPVYIQNHALSRLFERLDSVEEYFLLKYVFDSVSQCQFLKGDGSSLLIEFRLLDKKAGYLVAEVIKGKVLIETFLFITNTGTPEGEKLARITKLKKLDKKYLAIDKLSTFHYSDISVNKEVKQIFIDSGCGEVFEVDRNMIKKTENPKKPLAEKILSYMSRAT